MTLPAEIPSLPRSGRRKATSERITLAAVFAATALALAAPVSAMDRIAQQGRWFVDPAGRAVILRGGNVTLPQDVAGKAAQWSPDTPARMAEQGFNAVRLVMFFSGLMPEPGRIDAAYLDRIASAVDAYKAAGIQVMIDFHQDQYGALVGVRGMPDWAVFPDGHARLPGVEFPMGYFKDPAVQRSFDNFWANHPVAGTGKGVQDLYIDGLVAVARRFRDDPAVLGIDVMNEPATGTRCAQPDPAKAHCPELEQELLKPFYRNAASAIHAAAPDMIIFVEPFMLQGALGTPINTPIAGPDGRRGFSFHNYGPVKETRDRVNDFALAHAIKAPAAIINTEWGFSNNPVEITGQADDFDARHISWLAWTRGAFEALVDPTVPDRGNGNRVALLRAYARPYAQRTAGTPESLRFDPASGTMTYSYKAILPGGRRPSAQMSTDIRMPAAQYPSGYTAVAEGGTIVSAPNAATLVLNNKPGAKLVRVTLSRSGELPPPPPVPPEQDREAAALRALPPIPDQPLSRNSLFGHIVSTPGGRELLDKEVPGMMAGLSHAHGWEKMTLAGIQSFASSVLTDAKLADMDSALRKLPVRPGPVRAGDHLTIDSLTSDLLADPRARAILDREAPGLAGSSQQGLFPQTRLRNLQPALPDLLSDAALARIEKALGELH